MQTSDNDPSGSVGNSSPQAQPGAELNPEIVTHDTFHGATDGTPGEVTGAASQREASGASSLDDLPRRPFHRNRNAVSSLVGIVGFFGVLGWATAMGAGDGSLANMLLDGPSAMFVVATVVMLMLAVYGFSGAIDAFAWIFRRPTPGKTAHDAVVFFQLAAAFALAAGFLGTMVGLVIMLGNMEDVSQIGGGMAISLLTQLYGVFIAVICIAIGAHIARRHNGAATAVPLARRSAGIAGITVIAGTLTALVAFGIVMLSVMPNL